MANTKPISYFSVDSVNLHEVAGTESHVFDNDVISIILNGSPYESSFLHEGHIYQLPEPRLLVVTSGEGDVHLNLEEYHVDKGTVILTPPDIILEIERCSQDTKICGIAIKWQIDIAETMVVKAKPKDYELLLRMLYLLWDMASPSSFRHDSVRQMVAAMMSNIAYMKQESELMAPVAIPSRSQLLFQQFKTLVNQYCDRQRNIPFYAERLRVSPHHLSAVISKASGHSVMYWINRAAVLHAKVLLKTTPLLTYEIAERMNFPNSPAFNNFFKRETGVTPRRFRDDSQP